MSRREDMELARRAREVFENPAMQMAVDAARSRHRRAWENTEPHEHEVREHAYQALRALDLVIDELNTLLDNGAIAARQIEREEKRNG